MSLAMDSEGWGFSITDRPLKLRLFHTVLAETLSQYPPSRPEPTAPEAFFEAWAKGIVEYRRLYEKALDVFPSSSYDSRVEWLDILHGSYDNSHNRYSLLLFQIGQNEPLKVSRYRVRQELIRKSGTQCQICHRQFEERRGKLIFEAHHIVPEVCGGKTELENMAALCKECHSSIKSPLQEMNAEISAEIKKMRTHQKVTSELRA